MLKGKYMPLSEANVSPVMVSAYDGQHIYINGGPSVHPVQSGSAPFSGSMMTADSKPEVRYTMGNYLGGGIAGVVYEAHDKVTHRHVAIKILNPVGYKLCSPNTLRRGEVIKKGIPILAHVRGMTMENVYWIKLPNKRELVACYVDGRGNASTTSTTNNGLRELTLEMCVALWRIDPDADDDRVLQPHHTHTHEEEMKSTSTITTGTTGISISGRTHSGSQLNEDEIMMMNPEDPFSLDPTISNQQIIQHLYRIPTIPAKYKTFLENRKCIYREIAHMHKLTGNSISGHISMGHKNVLQLFDVLEFIQPSKSTIFLVLELASGGELFDRIRIENGVEESIARTYFIQLLSGVLFCHQLGIVHRDLKPENLLLSDSDELKIADFGLSAHFIAAVSNNGSRMDIEEGEEVRLPSPARFRRLNSVVGSPHYVAPEILQNACYGYDGRKADMWSIGVILYGLLVGSLPFGKELVTCRRFLQFSEWIRSLPCDVQSGKLIYQECWYQSSPVTVIEEERQVEEAGPLMENGLNTRRPISFPTWLFPSTVSSHAVFLMTCLLHPDAGKRYSCQEAYRAKWIQNPIV